MSELWEAIAAYAVPIALGALTTFLGGLAAVVHKTAWYQRSPWYIKGLVKAALFVGVRAMQTQSEAIKLKNHGKLPASAVAELESAAVKRALQELVSQKTPQPAFEAILSAPNLETALHKQIPAIVEEVKKERKRFNPLKRKGIR